MPNSKDAKPSRTQSGILTEADEGDRPSNDYLLNYWELHEPLVGSLLDSIETIRSHFDEDGNILGSGQWRLQHIFRAVAAAEEAEKKCLQGLHEFYEATESQ